MYTHPLYINIDIYNIIYYLNHLYIYIYICVCDRIRIYVYVYIYVCLYETIFNDVVQLYNSQIFFISHYSCIY